MYVPKRLQKNFAIVKRKQGINIITNGILSCCEQHDFSISYLGELKTSLLGNKSIFPENDVIILNAKCKVCGKELQVFNGYTDGYDNCANNSTDQSSYELTNFLCPKCSKDYFRIEISFEYQSKEELEEDGIQEYENAFSWIWVSFSCTSCKKTYKNIVDLETS